MLIGNHLIQVQFDWIDDSSKLICEWRKPCNNQCMYTSQEQRKNFFAFFCYVYLWKFNHSIYSNGNRKQRQKRKTDDDFKSLFLLKRASIDWWMQQKHLMSVWNMSVSIEAAIFTSLLRRRLTWAYQDDMHIICNFKGKIAMRAAHAHNTWQNIVPIIHSFILFFVWCFAV